MAFISFTGCFMPIMLIHVHLLQKPLIQEGEQPFAMFQDLKRKYSWVLDTLEYDTSSNLIKGLEEAIVKPALEKRDELLANEVEKLRTRHIGDYL